MFRIPWSNNPQKVQSMNPPESGTEPLTGYRVWSLKKQSKATYLKSSTIDVLWPHRKALEKDVVAYTAGIHAVKDGARIIELWQEYFAEVAGEVYLWGHVKEFDLGYTAQFAYPKRFWVSGDTDPATIMELEDGYGVPVEFHEHLMKCPAQKIFQRHYGLPVGIRPGMVVTASSTQYFSQQAAQLQAQQQAQALHDMMMNWNSAPLILKKDTAEVADGGSTEASEAGAGLP
jgi:hypothetical protein